MSNITVDQDYSYFSCNFALTQKKLDQQQQYKNNFDLV